MIAEEVAYWLSNLARQTENPKFRNILSEASRLLVFQKKSMDALLKANATMAEKCAPMLEAEKEKRLYIFPCKPGEKVYAIMSCLGIMDVNGGDEFVECPFEGKCPHRFDWGCGEEPEAKAVFADTITCLIADEDDIGFSTEHCGGFTFNQIGKTVFFDKAQADKALEDMKNAKADNKN